MRNLANLKCTYNDSLYGRYEALTKLIEIWHHNPVHVGLTRSNASCYCVPPPSAPDPTAGVGEGEDETTSWGVNASRPLPATLVSNGSAEYFVTPNG